MKHKIEIKNQKIKFQNPERFKKELEGLEGKDNLLLEITRKKRTLAQNAYYWELLTIMETQNIGYTKEEWHDIFKQKFLPTKTIEIFGERYTTSSSSTRLNTKEFSEYIESIKRLVAQEFQIYLPEAGDFNF
jgi:hypothetical protein